ncbi:OmpW/AlkL family protein [Paraburkholderia sp. MM5482-R1]|uniref:OmpW/AlkL family protein n=1 Tax=unclassified Paraburkholderia TaxID=2615204 RepID=UPI003D1A98C6
MKQSQTITALAMGLSIAFACEGARADESANAQVDEPANTVKMGYVGVIFNTKSGNMSGPPGTTPPGLQVDLKNTSILGLSYQRRLSDHWSVLLQMGSPVSIRSEGAGNAAALGELVTAKAWFPAVMVDYTFTDFHGIRPYVGLGVNYTFFTDQKANAAYTNAFQGTQTSVKTKNSWGPVARLGVEYLFTKHWLVDFSYLHYWTRTTLTLTTATPGFGNITRTIGVKANPDLLGLVIGYRF